MSSRAFLLFSAALALAASSCAANSSEAPVRSPSRDYQPPPPRTSDGQVVGANGVEPRDSLEEGPQVGTENALAPGWKADEHGLHHDPKQRVGGAVDKQPEKEP